MDPFSRDHDCDGQRGDQKEGRPQTNNAPKDRRRPDVVSVAYECFLFRHKAESQMSCCLHEILEKTETNITEGSCRDSQKINAAEMSKQSVCCCIHLLFWSTPTGRGGPLMQLRWTCWTHFRWNLS